MDAEKPTPEQVLAQVSALAAEQDGVLGRRQLYAADFTRWQLQARLRGKRWQRTGRQTVCVTTGPLTQAATRWVAVLETGPRAALDGITALQAAGVKGLTDTEVHVIAPKSCTPLKPRGVVVHESRRFREPEILTDGVRRVRPAVAAVHAALWAVTNRQAGLFLVMPVQQRIVTAEQLREALSAVRRAPRRRLLLQLVEDVADGVHSLNELDVCRALRRRGLPEPTRQILVRLPTGRFYLDLEWDQWGVHLEIDGLQHEDADAQLHDVLRDLDVATTGRTTIRLPILAFRLDEQAVLDRLEALLRSRGWRTPAEQAA
ncbi:MAG: hypothetical protein H7323_06445 [Frankiales bacterium]|nr:hypothetical protein [Frankiales bacterium]